MIGLMVKNLTKNATVFPVPVLALAKTSLPKEEVQISNFDTH